MTASAVSTAHIGPIVAKALRDPDLHAKLLANPAQTLRDLQVEIPSNQSVTVLESDEHHSFFVLPVMTDADLQQLKDSLDSIHPNRLPRSRVLIQAAEDPNYRTQLFEDPRSVLQAAGMKLPAAVTITVFANSADHLYIVIPVVHHAHSHAHHAHH